MYGIVPLYGYKHIIIHTLADSTLNAMPSIDNNKRSMYKHIRHICTSFSMAYILHKTNVYLHKRPLHSKYKLMQAKVDANTKDLQGHVYITFT